MLEESFKISLNLSPFPPRFSIGIWNATDQVLRLWPDTYPDGYDAPILQARDNATRANWVISRKRIDWTVTRGSPHEIGPGEALNLSYDLSDGSWNVPADVRLASEGLWLRAILVYPKSEISARFGVFSGALATQWYLVQERNRNGGKGVAV